MARDSADELPRSEAAPSIVARMNHGAVLQSIAPPGLCGATSYQGRGGP